MTNPRRGAVDPRRRGRRARRARSLVRELTHAGYRVVEAPDGRTALDRFAARRPDLILLDLGLPDIDGLEVIRAVRREAATPIVILSGRFEEREKVEALDRGADDYVTKPFGVDELARPDPGRAAARRSGPRATTRGRLVAGPLELDAARHAVTRRRAAGGPHATGVRDPPRPA